MVDKTFRERVLKESDRLARRHRVLRIPVRAGANAVIGCYNMKQYVAANGKRFASLAAVLLFFAVSSSFTFPGLTGTNELDVADAAGEYDSGIVLAQNETEDLNQIEILDDEDVLDGYEDAELHGMDDVDKYSIDEILEENSKAPKGGLNKTGTDSEEAEFDKDDWRLVLINKQHPIPEDYTFTLGTIKGNMQCDERILDDLMAMLKTARKDGINLAVCSPYRDLNRQEVLFNRKIKAYMKKGMSYLEAYSLASKAVTVPGASEHQIGLALDIVSNTYTSLDEGFGETEAGKWLAENCSEFGFILRYPLGKEYITGIEYEPWHFRYVGKEAAAVIMEQEICLEEFIEGL